MGGRKRLKKPIFKHLGGDYRVCIFSTMRQKGCITRYIPYFRSAFAFALRGARSRSRYARLGTSRKCAFMVCVRYWLNRLKAFNNYTSQPVGQFFCTSKKEALWGLFFIALKNSTLTSNKTLFKCPVRYTYRLSL